MSTEQLLDELRLLSRADKLRAMQVLVLELAAEEKALLEPDASYPVWSPYDATGAAETLMELLQADKNAR